MFWINKGLIQNLTLLSILYLFYNRNLLDDCTKKAVDAQKYINNITFIATNNTIKGKNQKLAKAYNQFCKS